MDIIILRGLTHVMVAGVRVNVIDLSTVGITTQILI